MMLIEPERKRKKRRPNMRWIYGMEKDFRNFSMGNWKTKHWNGMIGERVVVPIIIIIIHFCINTIVNTETPSV
jgi:hypothetical protein